MTPEQRAYHVANLQGLLHCHMGQVKRFRYLGGKDPNTKAAAEHAAKRVAYHEDMVNSLTQAIFVLNLEAVWDMLNAVD